MNRLKFPIRYYKSFPIDNKWKPPKSVPYDSPISTDPSKRMKKGEEGKWLDMIEQSMKDFEKDNTTYYGYKKEE